MSDLELLKSAAMAAGITDLAECSFWRKGFRVRDRGGDGWYPWNPLVDDADALRLACEVPLLSINPVPGDAAATRRAIVCAAAAIADAQL